VVRKLSRTISGVTPVAVMTRPEGCPGRCVYCPTFGDTPQSYTPESPAVIRARAHEYDPRRQINVRLRTLEEMGHPVDKVELIIMGGTFLATPADYQYAFIKDCYDALNGNVSGTLAESRTANETAARRCVGLCVETRPDACSEDDIKRMLEFGATRVELGVQTIDDDIYEKIRRGHKVKDVINATTLLKRYGFKVYYHWMPGLPGSSPEHDLELSKELFDNSSFRPDGLKLYPTMVVRGTKLEEWYKAGEYIPYSEQVMMKLLADIKNIVPCYVRISRVLRDIPAQYITAGLRDSVREQVREYMAESGRSCRCIRCREYGHRVKTGVRPGEPELTRLDYDASGGREIFLSYEDKAGTLFGLLRLRIENTPPRLFDASTPLGLVRELHVFGPELALGERSGSAPQHRGLGKTLLAEAERITREECHADTLAILSGVGARRYYAELGYSLKNGYMMKGLVG
jgi:elongator complex protein 3